jgi:16S rRNA (uracil1498-N3)-methyltransferase
MQRFFFPDSLAAAGEVISLSSLHHQLTRVLRVQPGAQLVLLDNQGSERLVEVISVEKRDATGRVLEVRPARSEPSIAVTLYQCALKADKLEWVWQKATELGVTKLVPVISSRTIVRPVGALRSKQTRWETIVREAAEQSGRGRVPVLAPGCSLIDALANAPGLRLVAWEEGKSNPGLIHALTQASLPVNSVSLLIGPEGGLEADEIAQAEQAGWQTVSLGPRILRAETAALAAVALVMGALGEMGGAPADTIKSESPSQL